LRLAIDADVEAIVALFEHSGAVGAGFSRIAPRKRWRTRRRSGG
jgi:hypothetical protein